MQLLTEVKNSVELIGIDKTIQALKSARIVHFSDEILQTIISCICQEIGIKVEELLNSHEKNNDKRKVAICFCVYFLNEDEYFGFTHREIAQKLPLNLHHRQSIAYYHNIVKNAKISDICIHSVKSSNHMR